MFVWGWGVSSSPLVNPRTVWLTNEEKWPLPPLPGKIKVRLPGHGDVSEILLKDKNVPAHLLDARLADPLKILGPIY